MKMARYRTNKQTNVFDTSVRKIFLSMFVEMLSPILIPFRCLRVCFTNYIFTLYVYTFTVENVKALTFNTALTGVVEQKNPGHATSREERRDAIINAVDSSGADVVCLQEVWHTITSMTR